MRIKSSGIPDSMMIFLNFSTSVFTDAAELLGCIAHDDETKCIEAFLHVGRAERSSAALFMRKHDVSRRLRRREESVPVFEHIAVHALLRHRRHVREQ